MGVSRQKQVRAVGDQASLKAYIDDVLCLGPDRLFGPPPKRSRYETRFVDLGRCLVGNMGDVAEALAAAEGEDCGDTNVLSRGVAAGAAPGLNSQGAAERPGPLEGVHGRKPMSGGCSPYRGTGSRAVGLCDARPSEAWTMADAGTVGNGLAWAG